MGDRAKPKRSGRPSSAKPKSSKMYCLGVLWMRLQAARQTNVVKCSWFTAWEIASRAQTSAAARARTRAKMQRDLARENDVDDAGQTNAGSQNIAPASVRHRFRKGSNGITDFEVARDTDTSPPGNALSEPLAKTERSIRASAGQCILRLKDVRAAEGDEERLRDSLAPLLLHIFNGGARQWCIAEIAEPDIEDDEPAGDCDGDGGAGGACSDVPPKPYSPEAGIAGLDEAGSSRPGSSRRQPASSNGPVAGVEEPPGGTNSSQPTNSSRSKVLVRSPMAQRRLSACTPIRGAGNRGDTGGKGGGGSFVNSGAERRDNFQRRAQAARPKTNIKEGRAGQVRQQQQQQLSQKQTPPKDIFQMWKDDREAQCSRLAPSPPCSPSLLSAADTETESASDSVSASSSSPFASSPSSSSLSSPNAASRFPVPRALHFPASPQAQSSSPVERAEQLVTAARASQRSRSVRAGRRSLPPVLALQPTVFTGVENAERARDVGETDGHVQQGCDVLERGGYDVAGVGDECVGAEVHAGCIGGQDDSNDRDKRLLELLRVSDLACGECGWVCRLNCGAGIGCARVQEFSSA